MYLDNSIFNGQVKAGSKDIAFDKRVQTDWSQIHKIYVQINKLNTNQYFHQRKNFHKNLDF